MDETSMREGDGPLVIADGFPGQRLIVLPAPRVRAALAAPGTSHLVVTDCGFFPEAHAHGRSRSDGIDQAIVMVCARGEGWCEIGGQRHRVLPGQVLVIPPGHPHRYGADRDNPWTLWWVHVAGPDLRELLRTGRITAGAPVREVRDVYRVLALIEEVVRTLGRDTTAVSLLAASGAAWHLLTLLSATSRAPGASSSAIERARDYLSDHLAERVPLADLAALANMSPSHFAARFRQRFGLPVLRYQKELRMARARELLDTSDRPIGDIGREVGYDDSLYFSRQFSIVHGMGPREYRRHRKG